MRLYDDCTDDTESDLTSLMPLEEPYFSKKLIVLIGMLSTYRLVRFFCLKERITYNLCMGISYDHTLLLLILYGKWFVTFALITFSVILYISIKSSLNQAFTFKWQKLDLNNFKYFSIWRRFYTRLFDWLEIVLKFLCKYLPESCLC